MADTSLSIAEILQLASSTKRLQGMDLSALSLDFKDFSGVSFRGSKLLNSTMAKAVFDGSSFEYADLTTVQAERASFLKASFSESKLSGSNFSGANFAGSMFTGIEEIRGADFKNSDLTNTVWQNVRLVNCDFTGANFTKARFVGNVFVDGGTFRDAIFAGANLAGMSVRASQSHPLRMTGANLAGAINAQLYTAVDIRAGIRRLNEAKNRQTILHADWWDLLNNLREMVGLTHSLLASRLNLPDRTYYDKASNPHRWESSELRAAEAFILSVTGLDGKPTVAEWKRANQVNEATAVPLKSMNDIVKSGDITLAFGRYLNANTPETGFAKYVSIMDFTQFGEKDRKALAYINYLLNTQKPTSWAEFYKHAK